jgi:hypothetical protein
MSEGALQFSYDSIDSKLNLNLKNFENIKILNEDNNFYGRWFFIYSAYSKLA